MLNFEDPPLREAVPFDSGLVPEVESAVDRPEESVMRGMTGNGLRVLLPLQENLLHAIDNVHRIVVGEEAGQMTRLVAISKEVGKEYSWYMEGICFISHEVYEFAWRER